jgi:hypothetical protein
MGLGEKKWFAEDERGRDDYLTWRAGFHGAKPLEPCPICLGVGVRTPMSTRSTSATPTTAGMAVAIAGDLYTVRPPDTADDAVKVWSSRPLSFDNKPPWQRQLVQELREAITELHLERDSALHGTFATEDAGGFDIENRLFYNVGAGAFPELPRAIVFERLYAVPEPAPGKPLDQYPYFAAYAAASLEVGFRYWRACELIARFDRIDVERVTGGQTSRLVWHAMRRAGDAVTIVPGVPAIRRFGIDLTLHLPPGTTVKPANVVKSCSP